ncbi:TetR family transcriptional regulator [Prauserella marina]|uniref:Regulatory protein, tetR family n=1 Tax=Prauserella marina TaxID=530584 RepID=A0A222VMJ3_9PSEU|nr:TetR/AcrR family transcriptional regulator [Prauserella marina]ASR35146.1 TetR family transcriptional regulator [Prauserella marina]PWV85093.1 TetR family transcriptional regulator [Prauserella marina]SDC04931.1 regulatory protein, tetR family [Prauserella marina]
MRNPERRTALVDAAIEVLARDGARGLTFRAVDTEAAVPNGTASNYFANRDDLLNQVGAHIHLRLAVDPSKVATTSELPSSRERLTELMQALFQHISGDRTGWLALVELRMEATRRPELRAALTSTLRDNLNLNVEGHRASGLPGDDMTTVLLYYAMTGLILEHLTVPDALTGYDENDLIATFVTRALAH